jgi:hypothetical protein
MQFGNGLLEEAFPIFFAAASSIYPFRQVGSSYRTYFRGEKIWRMAVMIESIVVRLRCREEKGARQAKLVYS